MDLDLVIGNRGISTVLGAVLQARHYRAALNMLRVYERPMDSFLRYLFAAGQYPCKIRIRTAAGPAQITLYSCHDLLTVNEIFCRKDYDCPRDGKVVVDFGSNIGISALFFLTHCPNAIAYLFEPLPVNQQRLRDNLSAYRERYILSEHAVGLVEGNVLFGYEPSGRYGGINQPFPSSMSVHCRPANAILDGVLSAHGRIDVLKIDIETLERELVFGLGNRAARIGTILVEQAFESNPLSGTHQYTQYGSIARFTAIA